MAETPPRCRSNVRPVWQPAAQIERQHSPAGCPAEHAVDHRCECCADAWVVARGSRPRQVMGRRGPRPRRPWCPWSAGSSRPRTRRASVLLVSGGAPVRRPNFVRRSPGRRCARHRTRSRRRGSPPGGEGQGRPGPEPVVHGDRISARRGTPARPSLIHRRAASEGWLRGGVEDEHPPVLVAGHGHVRPVGLTATVLIVERQPGLCSTRGAPDETSNTLSVVRPPPCAGAFPGDLGNGPLVSAERHHRRRRLQARRREASCRTCPVARSISRMTPSTPGREQGLPVREDLPGGEWHRDGLIAEEPRRAGERGEQRPSGRASGFRRYACNASRAARSRWVPRSARLCATSRWTWASRAVLSRDAESDGPPSSQRPGRARARRRCRRGRCAAAGCCGPAPGHVAASLPVHDSARAMDASRNSPSMGVRSGLSRRRQSRAASSRAPR